jgi:Raf kinase inhibitor-like YbhB/YbcL family protein
MVIDIKSTVFSEGEPIPQMYTCDSANISPPLQWKSVPEDSKSLTIICEDPDAHGGTWTHWLLFNLPGDVKALTEMVMEREILENGAKQGLNDFGTVGYRGPCPPRGTRRYYFKIYALDVELGLEARTTRQELLKSMEGHILDKGEIMGIYSR